MQIAKCKICGKEYKIHRGNICRGKLCDDCYFSLDGWNDRIKKCSNKYVKFCNRHNGFYITGGPLGKCPICDSFECPICHEKHIKYDHENKYHVYKNCIKTLKDYDSNRTFNVVNYCETHGFFVKHNNNKNCPECDDENFRKQLKLVQYCDEIINKNDSTLIGNLLMVPIDDEIGKKRAYPEKNCLYCVRTFIPHAPLQNYCRHCWIVHICKHCGNYFITDEMKFRYNVDYNGYCSHICSGLNLSKIGIFANNGHDNGQPYGVYSWNKGKLIIDENQVLSFPSEIIPLNDIDYYVKFLQNYDITNDIVRVLYDENKQIVYSAQTNSKDYEVRIVKSIIRNERNHSYIKFNPKYMKIIWGFKSKLERLIVEGYYDNLALCSLQNRRGYEES